MNLFEDIFMLSIFALINFKQGDENQDAGSEDQYYDEDGNPVDINVNNKKLINRL